MQLKKAGQWTSGFNPFSVFLTVKTLKNNVNEYLHNKSLKEWTELGQVISKTNDKISSAKETLKNLSKAVDPEKISGSSGSSGSSSKNTKSAEELTKTGQELLKEWKQELRQVASEFGMKVTSEYRPGAKTRGNGSTSYHAMSVGKEHGRALDIAGSPRQMSAFFDYIRKAYPAQDILELIYSPKGIVKNGQFSSQIKNSKTKEDHYNHVHVSLKNH